MTLRPLAFVKPWWRRARRQSLQLRVRISVHQAAVLRLWELRGRNRLEAALGALFVSCSLLPWLVAVCWTWPRWSLLAAVIATLGFGVGRRVRLGKPSDPPPLPWAGEPRGDAVADPHD